MSFLKICSCFIFLFFEIDISQFCGFFFTFAFEIFKENQRDESSFAYYEKAEIIERNQGLFNDRIGNDYVWYRMDRIFVAQ